MRLPLGRLGQGHTSSQQRPGGIAVTVSERPAIAVAYRSKRCIVRAPWRNSAIRRVAYEGFVKKEEEAMQKRLLMIITCAVAASGALLAVPTSSAAAAGATMSTNCRSIYTVRHGDTLSAIGARYHVSYRQIAKASGIANPNLIYPGQRICIPGSSTGGRATHTPSSSSTSGANAAPSSSSKTPAGLCAWCAPAEYHSFGPVSDFRGDSYSSSRGQCTWWAATRRLDENFWGLGTYAYQWTFNARARGFRTGTSPAVGASVVFQPGVDGASSWGHVGHVEKVYSGGWFLISEMNFYWNGGGWDRVDYRYVHTGPGVSFLY